jgi:hypothetical protein
VLVIIEHVVGLAEFGLGRRGRSGQSIWRSAWRVRRGDDRVVAGGQPPDDFLGAAIDHAATHLWKK